MADVDWVPPGIDPTKPNVARVYDCFLGGKNNFAVDREVVQLVLPIVPEAREYGEVNRAFLRRVIHYMVAEAKVRQFIDIGSGLPTQGNVHEIAQEIDPQARVVYVDNDPVVLTHARALLGDTDTTRIITADLRHTEAILGNPTVGKFIDFDQPVGLLLLAILHHINDTEDPIGIMARLRDALAPGSHLAISHFHNPGSAYPADAQRAIESEKIFNEKFGTGRWRTHEEILAYFGDFELLEPGLVPVPEWRPDPGDRGHTATHRMHLAGLARKG